MKRLTSSLLLNDEPDKKNNSESSNIATDCRFKVLKRFLKKLAPKNNENKTLDHVRILGKQHTFTRILGKQHKQKVTFLVTVAEMKQDLTLLNIYCSNI